MTFKKLYAGIYLVVILLGSNLALSAPYWAGKGAVVEYVAHRDNTYVSGLLQRGVPPETVTTVSMYYLRNGSEYTIKAYNTSYLRFEIIEDSAESFRVRAELVLSNVTIITDASSPRFWSAEEVINHTCRLGTCLYRLETLKITGIYRILKQGDQVVAGGKVYGRTFLWIDPTEPPENGTVLFDADGTVLKVQRLENVNQSFKTYSGTFGPPLVKIYTNKININLGSVSAEGMNVYLYDGSDFVLLSWFGLAGIADLRAMGIVTMSLMDQRAGSEGLQTLGPTLYRFTPAPQTQEDEGEQSPLTVGQDRDGYGRVIFYAVLATFTVVLVVRLKR